MKIFFKNKSLEIKVKSLSPLGKFTGLMFRSSDNENLLFKFKKHSRHSIHSIFVFHKFLAVWLNGENKVVQINLVSPFCLTIKPSKPAGKLIEIPFNKKNEGIIKKLVGKEIFK